MKAKEYRQLTNEELNKLIKELGMQLIKSHSFMEKPKVKRENRSKIRREIAKLKTILKERENEHTRKTNKI